MAADEFMFILQRTGKGQSLAAAFLATLLHEVLTFLSIYVLLFYFLKIFIYLFSDRKGRERERKRDINWSPLVRPQMGTQPVTLACALTGNQTSDLSVSQASA